MRERYVVRWLPQWKNEPEWIPAWDDYRHKSRPNKGLAFAIARKCVHEDVHGEVRIERHVFAGPGADDWEWDERTAWYVYRDGTVMEA